jgi:hypothetical protein
LARHSHDHDAYQRVLDERGDCPQCWADTAKAAADAAELLLIRCGPLPHMDVYGNVSGATVDWLLRVIGSCLRAEEFDRRGLGL